MNALPELFSPITIGTMTLKNRIVMAPMTTNYGTPGQEPTERLMAYLEERAKGGAGLVTVEVCTVDSRHRYQMNSLSLGDDRFIPLHAELVKRIQQHGAKVQPQITHPGPESMSIWVENLDALGPSPICGLGNRPPCRELATHEIEPIIEQFAAAAVRAQKAGYDGMELHAAHAYMLIGSFLSPWRNKRRDEYGKRAGRYKLLLEVIRRMKAATGNTLPLTLRISGFERLKGGREINETQEWAPRMVEAGVDAFHVSGGYGGDFEASMIITNSNFSSGHNLAQAEALKQVVDVPVMAVGRIHDPLLANEAIRSGQADLIVMGRPLIADPELPNKAKAGRFSEIRRCLSCQNCVDGLMQNDMNCAVNATSGRELSLQITPAEKKKKVLVVGGGTAGMEAARVAALRGHEVTLCERSPMLGGALRIASTVHAENRPFFDFLMAEMARLPIAIRTNTTVTPERVREIKPDVILIATGAKVIHQPIPGDDLPHVSSGAALRSLLAFTGYSGNNPLLKTAVPLLALLRPVAGSLLSPQFLDRASKRWLPLGQRIAIIGCDLAAIELAQFLAKRGRHIHIVSEGDRLAPEVGMRRRSDEMENLDRLGIAINTSVKICRITPEGVVIANQNGTEHLLRADQVIIAGEAVADQSLAESIKELAPEIHTIGDCNGLGLIAGATLDAMRVAVAI